LKSERQRATGGVGRATPLYQQATDLLSAQIVSGEIPAGSLLQETRLASDLGISRAPARRTLALLAERGLLAKRPGRGYVVAAPPGRVQPGAAAHPVAARAPERPLVALAAWETILAEVESQIVARIPFGNWRLKEADLARHFAVSRTVARDVLGRLQQRGLVRKDERSHWFAPALTPDRIVDLYEMRALLEPVALAKAAPLIPAMEVSAVRARLIEALERDSAEIDGDLLDRLEADLHVGLLGYCPNREMIRSITHHQSLLIAHGFLYRWTRTMFDREPFLPEHFEIVDRLARGDGDGAARALGDHLRMSSDRAIARVAHVSGRFAAEPLPYLERISD